MKFFFPATEAESDLKCSPIFIFVKIVRSSLHDIFFATVVTANLKETHRGIIVFYKNIKSFPEF